MIEKEAAPYAAFAAILGVVEAVILSKSTLAQGNESIMYWLVYTITCGVIINYRPGLSAWTLALLAPISPTVIALVYTFKFFSGGTVRFSGVTILLKDLSSPEMWRLLGFAWIASVLAIWVFSFARPIVLAILANVTDTDKATKIEKAINWTVRIGSSAGLIFKAFQ